MHPLSTRQTLGILTLGLFVAIWIVVTVAQISSDPNYLTPHDLVGDSAPIGETVVFAGLVVSCGDSTLTVAPKDASRPIVRVTLADPARVSPEPGIRVIIQGELARAGVVEAARVTAPSPPSAYVRATERQ